MSCHFGLSRKDDRYEYRSRSPPLAAPPPHKAQQGRARPATGDGPTYAQPTKEANLGHHVEIVLRILADMVEGLHVGEVEGEVRRALRVGRFARRQPPYLEDCAEQVGQLCPAAEKELTTANSIMMELSSIARMSNGGDKRHAFSLDDERWVSRLPRRSRSEQIASAVRLAKRIRQRLSCNTAARWREMARVAIAQEVPPYPMNV